MTIASSPDAREQSRFARNGSHGGNSASVRSTSPVTKKKARDSQSLRSSGDRHFKGGEIDELRATAQRAGVKLTRPRHKKKGQPQRAQEPTRGQKTSQGPRFVHKPKLMQCRENTEDPIDDDLEINEDPPAPKSKSSATAFTSAQFQRPVDTSNSEDEEPGDDEQDEIGTLPAAKHSESAAARPEQHPVLGSKKRPPASPDEVQSSRDPKRRSRTSDQADLPRTNCVEKHIPGRRDQKPQHRVLPIKSAVCEPCYIYPARDGMHEKATGATNEECTLLRWNFDEAFIPLGSGGDLKALAWITPNISRVNRMEYNEKSPIVLVRAPQILLIKFEDNEDASSYVELCKAASRNPDYVNTDA